MPYGHAIVAMSLIDFDAGDDTWGNSTWDQVAEYMSERLLLFRFSEHARKKDKLEMSFRNEDFALLDAPAFVKGQKLLVTWGWPGQTAAPRRMVVQSVKGGNPITVVAHCTMSLMDLKKNARYMEGATDSEFVREVARQYGYKGTLAHIDETSVRHDIAQPRWMTDAKMLRRLAVRNSFDFYIDASGLHWHKRRTQREPVKTFIYRTDPGRGTILEAPTFEANLSKGVAKVRVLAFDPILKVPVEETYGVDDDDETSLGTEEEIQDPDASDIGLRAARVSQEEVVPGGLLSAEDGARAAKAVYRETALKKYKMSMRIVGDAQLPSKAIIGVYGISSMFDGLYFTEEVVHEIVPGAFTCLVKSHKDALGKVPSAKKGTKKAPNKDASEAPPEATSELKKMITTTVAPDGTRVPAFIFTDDGGATGQTSEMTPEEYNELNVSQKEALAQEGAQSALPDM